VSVLALFTPECVLCSVSQKRSCHACLHLACTSAARAAALSRVNGSHGKAFNGGTGKDRCVPQQMRSRPWSAWPGCRDGDAARPCPLLGAGWLPVSATYSAAAGTTAMKRAPCLDAKFWTTRITVEHCSNFVFIW
jgi:hypothetical protein